MKYCTVCRAETPTNMGGSCIRCHHLKEDTKYCATCKRPTVPIDSNDVLHCATCLEPYISRKRIQDFIEEIWRGIFQKRPGIINKLKFRYIAEKIYQWWKGKK